LCFRHDCTFLGYQSFEESILVHWSLTLCMLKDVKLVFKPDCTILRYQSCEGYVLLHWTQNYVWESRNQSCEASILVHWTQNDVLGLNALFRDTKVAKHPFYAIGPKLIFGCVLVHFANLLRVKDEKLVFQI
jgi:hypothetical protein